DIGRRLAADVLDTLDKRKTPSLEV
ncbi:MAG: hypothetical protein QOD39_2795, partial [Mycobacterium sp.]|nr:hypothetical protein [Mycobacterium sp.]